MNTPELETAKGGRVASNDRLGFLAKKKPVAKIMCFTPFGLLGLLNIQLGITGLLIQSFGLAWLVYIGETGRWNS